MARTFSFKTDRLSLLLLVVVIPGLIISGLAIFSISQQKKAKELKISENYVNELEQLCKKIQDEVDITVIKTFQEFYAKPVQLNSPSSIQQTLKELLLKYSLVKYPFIINGKGNYIFPFSTKSSIPLIEPKFPRNGHKEVEFYLKEGERLEFSERNFPGALKAYVKCQKFKGWERLKPYIFNAIARCYFKLKKYPQALSYYNSIFDYYSSLSLESRNFSIYFSALCQTARTYLRIGKKGEAVKIYLQLYDKILQYESIKPVDKFAFYKNEALEFLNSYMKEQIPQGNSRSKKKIPENLKVASGRLREFGDTDFSLRWQYFEYENTEQKTDSPQKNEDFLHFSKIREFYLAADEKTQFYKAVKELDFWKKPGADIDSDGEIETKLLASPGTDETVEVIFRKIPISDNKLRQSSPYFFGFKISQAFLNSQKILDFFSEFPQRSGLKVVTLSPKTGEKNLLIGDNQGFVLKKVDFDKFFPGVSLALVSQEKNIFSQMAKKEMFLYYFLIGAFILLLMIGIFFFYKYLSREAQLVRLKSQFTDQASHSLKTPLTRIRMLAEKLQLGWVSNETKKQEYLKTIQTESDRMNEMIVNMLDFSKIEVGKKQYNFEQRSFSLVVKSVLEAYSPYIKNLGFQLEVNIEENLPLIPIDEEAIKLIIINLLQNAVKYSRDKKFIGLRLFWKGDKIILEVEDRGIGIEAKDLKKIFDRFYRINGEHIQNVEGSGLGLFLVKHAVQAHHGEIEVRSQPGRGTCFKIKLAIRNFQL